MATERVPAPLDGKPPAQGRRTTARKTESSHPTQPRRSAIRFLKLMRHYTDGTVALPTIEEVTEAARTRPPAELLADLKPVARQSEARGRAAMTAAAFAITTAGLLLNTHIDLDAIVAPAGVFAFLGLFAGLISQSFYVGPTPMRFVEMDQVMEALAATYNKEAYGQLAMIFSAVALGVEAIGLVIHAI